MKASVYATFPFEVFFNGTMTVPVIFRHRGFKMFFYSSEGSPREPVHVHVEKSGSEAKFWIEPAIGVAYNDGFSAKQPRELVALVHINEARIRKAWHDYFG